MSIISTIAMNVLKYSQVRSSILPSQWEKDGSSDEAIASGRPVEMLLSNVSLSFDQDTILLIISAGSSPY